MLSRSTQPNAARSAQAKARYFLTWRWHFYAGLYVIPFMLMLCITGMIMLFDEEIEQASYASILTVAPQAQPLPVSEQLAAVRAAFPQHAVTQFIPSSLPTLANRFSISDESGGDRFVTVNPYTAEVLGTIDRSDSLYQWANKIHSTLLLGDSGDYLIEVAASLGILLLVSGIYLWWPKDNASRAGFLRVRWRRGRRVFLRDVHANLGGVLSLALLFFLISGLSWTGFWGKQWVQAWNTFPTYYTWGDKPQSALTHQSLNHGAEKEMPWNLEQAPMPQSHDHSKMNMPSEEFHSSRSIDVDTIVAKANALGYTRYRIYFPQSATGVYTLAANSMAGDNRDPRRDLTEHFDQYDGQLITQVTWSDYTPFAKWMAASVSLHQGSLGMLNKLLNVAVCIGFIVLSVAGACMWWLRRPSATASLGAPPTMAHPGLWKAGLITVVLLCAAFPLGGLTIVGGVAFDWLIIRRFSPLQRVFNR